MLPNHNKLILIPIERRKY